MTTTRLVFAVDETQRACPHTPGILIEVAPWTEMLCAACLAIVFDLGALDEEDLDELFRLAVEAGLDPEIRT